MSRARGAGLVVLLWLTLRLLARGLGHAPAGAIIAVLDGANSLFHEAGHVLWGVLGSATLAALGGSLTQVLIPAACAAEFLRQRQPDGYAVAAFWTGESLTGVAAYVADARRMRLPLYGDGIHDWGFLLDRWGVRAHAEGLGAIVYALALLVIVSALVTLALSALGSPPPTGRARARPARR